MHLPGLTYRGAPLDDLELLARLPSELQQLLAIRNGFVAFRGAVHVRGACTEPAWHALRPAWEGRDALHLKTSVVHPADVPFAQDALGRQLLLREGKVSRFDPQGAALEELGLDLTQFLQAIYEDPQRLLPLDALLEFEATGATLRPGETLAQGRSFIPRAVSGAVTQDTAESEPSA